MKKRILSLLMVLVLCFSLVPAEALAEESESAAQEEVEKDEPAPAPTPTPTPTPTAEPALMGESAPEKEPTAEVSPAPTAPIEDGEDGSEGGDEEDDTVIIMPAEDDKTDETDETDKTDGIALLIANEENGIKVQAAGEYVAQANGVEYETLQKALNETMDADEEVNITLLKSVTESITVYTATTIDMAGHSITGNINAEGSLTLINGTVKGNVVVNEFTMTAPAGADAAIDGGLEVESGSCYISGAKVGVKGTLSFSGNSLTITGTEKAVVLSDWPDCSLALYGSTRVDGTTSTEAKPQTDSYGKVIYTLGADDLIVKKLSTTKENYVPPVAKVNGNEYTSLGGALDNANDGDTVTLLADINGSFDISGGSIGKAVTLDLNGKSWNATATVYSSNTLKLTGSGTVDTVTLGGKLDIQDDGVKVNNLNVTSAPSPEMSLKHGTFGTITIADNVSITAYDLLADGYAFCDKLDGKVVNGKLLRPLTRVTVMPHVHKIVDGKCPCGATCLHTRWNNGVCIDCDRTCAHQNIDTTNYTCNTCKAELAASLTANGNTDYYVGLADALNAAGAAGSGTCTVTLLKSAAMERVKDEGIMEAADVTIAPGQNNFVELNLQSYSITGGMITIGARGNMGSLTVTGSGKVDAEIIVNDGSLTLKAFEGTISAVTINTAGYGLFNSEEATWQIDMLDLKNAKSSCYLSGGTIGTIMSDASVNAGSLLAPGYVFQKEDGSYVNNAASANGLENVTVTKPRVPDDKITAPTEITGLVYSGTAQALVTAGSVGAGYGTMQYSLNEQTWSDITPTATDAGTYTVYYKAAGSSNYKDSDVKFVSVTIAPKKIDHVKFTKSVSKTYDGTAEVDLTSAEAEIKKRLSFFDENKNSITVPADAYEISNVRFITNDGTNTSESDAGAKDGIWFRVTLKSGNYVLQSSIDAEPYKSRNYLQEADVKNGVTFAITQAAPPDLLNNKLEQYVFNDLAKTYEIDLAAVLKGILPKLTYPCEYGDITYDLRNVGFNSRDYYDYADSETATLVNGILRLPIKAATGGKGEIGIVTVNVKTVNYQDFPLIFHVMARDKLVPVPDGTASASSITYGQALADSTVTGTMKDPDTGAEVTGAFAWKDGTVKPNAGSYDAEWTFTPDAPEYASAVGKVTVTVNRKSIADATVTMEQLSLVYNGEQQYPKIKSVVLDGVTLTPLQDYGFSCNAMSDVGTYDDFYVGGNKNYTDRVSVTWSITPREVTTPTITVSGAPFVYTGSAITPTVTVKDDLDKVIDPKEYTVSYTDNTNAGTATITITDNADGNYIVSGSKTFTIAKAAAPAISTMLELYVTNGLAKTYEVELSTLMPTLTAPGKYGTISYGSPAVSVTDDRYTYDDIKIEDGVLSLTVPKIDLDNEDKVWSVTVPVTTTNYSSFDLTIDVYSKNKTVPVPDGTISASGITYGDALSDSTITGKMKDPDTGAEVTGAFAWKDGTIKPDAGSYDAEWTFTPDALEYAATTGNATVTVERKSIAKAAVTLEKVSFVYDGTRKDPVVSSVVLDGKTLVYGASNDYGYNYDMASDAGDYTLTVTGNHNYTGTVTVNWSITPRTVTAPAITVSGAPFVYTGSAITPAVTVKDDLGNTVDPKEYTVSCKDNTNAGTATITITDNAGGNYIVSGSKTFTIEKAASALTTAPAAKTGLVYKGTEQELITAGTATGGTVKYRLGTTGEFSAAIPKAANAGEYTVYYYVEGDANHNSQKEVQSVTLSIAKAAVTVTAANKSAFVGDPAPDLSKPVEGTDYTVSGLFGTDKLTGTVKLAYVDANGNAVTPSMAATGETIIRASGVTAPKENYTLAFMDGKLTVSVRPTYIITATAGLHGSISPVGSVSVIHGGSQSFTITPDAGYAIANVRIDGASIGAAKYYTFENVTSAHTIEAVFMRVNGNPQTGVMVDEVDGSYYESAWQGE